MALSSAISGSRNYLFTIALLLGSKAFVFYTSAELYQTSYYVPPLFFGFSSSGH